MLKKTASFGLLTYYEYAPGTSLPAALLGGLFDHPVLHGPSWRSGQQWSEIELRRVVQQVPEYTVSGFALGAGLRAELRIAKKSEPW